MINEPAQPFQSYLLTVVKGKWVDWTTNFLAKPVPRENRTQGFQELTGSEGADVRTRELEFYRLGFLKKRLIRERSSHGSEVPEGWQMLLDGELPISPEGFLAAVLGEALNQVIDSALTRRLEDALKLLGFVSTFTWGVKKGSTVVSPLLVFHYVLDTALTGTVGMSLSHDDRVMIQRWVSQAVSNTLDSEQHAANLIVDYIGSSNQPRLILQSQSTSGTNSHQSGSVTKVTTTALTDEVIRSLGQLPPFNELLRHKASLFWGAENGLYGTTAWEHAHLLSSLVKADQERLSAGKTCLFDGVIEGRLGSNSLLVEISTLLNRHDSLKHGWRAIMKSIYEASLEALVQIRPWTSTTQDLFFPRGILQETISDSILRVPEAQVPLVPKQNDRIFHEDVEYLVVSVARDVGDLLIKVK